MEKQNLINESNEDISNLISFINNELKTLPKSNPITIELYKNYNKLQDNIIQPWIIEYGWDNKEMKTDEEMQIINELLETLSLIKKLKTDMDKSESKLRKFIQTEVKTQISKAKYLKKKKKDTLKVVEECDKFIELLKKTIDEKNKSNK